MKKPPPPYSFLTASGNACITACVALVIVASIMTGSFLLLTTTGIPAEPLAEDTAAHHRALIAELQRMASHLERANHRLDDTAAAGVRFDSLDMRLAEVHAMLGVLAEAMSGSAVEVTDLRRGGGDEDDVAGEVEIASVSEEGEDGEVQIVQAES
jgi:hypothetical protein